MVSAVEHSDSRIDFEKFFQGLQEEKRDKVLIVLDYVLNYNRGERISHKLREMNFGNEQNDLIKLGVVHRAEGYHKNFRYEILSINEEITEFVKELIEKNLYPVFADTKRIKREIRQVIASNFRSALKLFEEVTQYENVPTYTLSSEHSYDTETREFGNLLSRKGFGYYIGYWTVKAAAYYDEFIFREKPIDFKALFLEVIKEEMRTKLSSLSPVERWCIFLKHVNPKARDEFFFENRARFLPEEMRNAIKKTPEIKSKAFTDIFDPVLNEIKSKFSATLRNLFLRDVNCLLYFSLLLALGDTQENMCKIGSYKLNKLKEIDSTRFNKIMEYVDVFCREGIILKDSSDLIIPTVVKETFESETRGNILETKIFSDKLDAENFVCDLVGKAENRIKIWDPYVTKNTLQLISEGVGNKKVEVEILTSEPRIYPDLKHFLKSNISLRVKIIYKKTKNRCESPFHDRYAIVDDAEIWHFGPSLHGAGLREAEMAGQLKREWGERILDSFKYNWEKDKEGWEAENWTIREFKS